MPDRQPSLLSSVSTRVSSTECHELQWKIAAALAAGNTIVLKPSEVASVTCLELAEIASTAGLPDGVLNVITGTGQDAGAPLR